MTAGSMPVASFLARTGVLSRPGGREHNQDACAEQRGEHDLCCVLADGAGGHGGGDIASQLVVRHVIEQAAPAPLARADEVRDLLVDANVHLRRHRADSLATRDMHSTVVALFLDLARGEALWGHVGDSRLYVFRGGSMLSHTRDHSVVQAMVDAGFLMPEQIRSHPRRSELQSALGTEPEDLLVSTATRPWLLAAGDVFLLCSDGLWEYVDEAAMCATLTRAATPAGWLEAMERLVVQHAAERGHAQHDNFSAVAVWIDGG